MGIFSGELTVSEVIARTHNVLSVRFYMPPEAQFKAGQFLHIAIGEKKLWRYLSISNSPTEKGFLECTKKLTGSDFSLLFEKLKKGDKAVVKFPFGKFTFEGEHKKIAFLSGGIGITPIRSICKFVVDNKLPTDMALLYSNRTVEDIAFKDDFDKMLKEDHNFKVTYIISDCDSRPISPDYMKGRIDAGVVKSVVPDYRERKFFICGPPVMVESMKNILAVELELKQTDIITENFTGY